MVGDGLDGVRVGGGGVVVVVDVVVVVVVVVGDGDVVR